MKCTFWNVSRKYNAQFHNNKWNYTINNQELSKLAKNASFDNSLVYLQYDRENQKKILSKQIVFI